MTSLEIAALIEPLGLREGNITIVPKSNKLGGKLLRIAVRRTLFAQVSVVFASGARARTIAAARANSFQHPETRTLTSSAGRPVPQFFVEVVVLLPHAVEEAQPLYRLDQSAASQALRTPPLP